jgi:hypothetical protein
MSDRARLYYVAASKRNTENTGNKYGKENRQRIYEADGYLDIGCRRQ